MDFMTGVCVTFGLFGLFDYSTDLPYVVIHTHVSVCLLFNLIFQLIFYSHLPHPSCCHLTHICFVFVCQAYLGHVWVKFHLCGHGKLLVAPGNKICCQGTDFSFVSMVTRSFITLLVAIGNKFISMSCLVAPSNKKIGSFL